LDRARTSSSNVTRGIQSASDVPQALAAPYRARRTGVLHFVRDGERRSLRFRDGEVLYAATNVAGDHLGETLVRHGWLRREELGLASVLAQQLGRRLGSVLVSMGILDEGLLPHALGIHARAVVEGLLGWSGGSYEFTDDAKAGAPRGAAAKPGTGDLIALAARRIDDEEALRRALGDLDRALKHRKRRPVALTGAEAFVRSQVDGVRTARQIVALRPEATRETLRSLLALLCVGLLEWCSRRPAARPSAPSGGQDAEWLALMGQFEHQADLTRAETFVAIERYWEAIQLLEKILPRLRRADMKQEARVLLARAYLHNPKWVRRAEETLQCALDEDEAEGPPSVEALFLLGSIYARQGLKRRAEALLRRALALQPDHGPAAAELRALSRGPLVKRLFARRA
jgi:hypothetical protein